MSSSERSSSSYCYGTEGYVLQIDIKGYYPNMRHDAVKAKFRRYLNDEVYEAICDVLDTQTLMRYVITTVGTMYSTKQIHLDYFGATCIGGMREVET